MRTQPRSIDNVLGARHHIGHQPPAAAIILTRNHRRLRNRRVTRQHRLDLTRLDPEAAQLHLAVGTPQKVQNPIRTPARQIPGPVHPAPRPTKRIGNKPLPRQISSPEITPRQPRPRNVKLPCHPGRNRLQSAVQDVNPRVPDRTANRDFV